jgi:hypothetical protein
LNKLSFFLHISHETWQEINRNNPAKNLVSVGALRAFLVELLRYRLSHELSAGSEDSLPLALIGDSHCLSYAAENVVINGQNYRVRSNYVSGAKAFHLGRATRNSFIHDLQSAIRRCQSGTKVIFFFGEIDCRVNEGVWKHYRKSGGSLESIVEDTVNRYFSNVLSMAREQCLDASFANVPAPLASFFGKVVGDVSSEDELGVIRVTRLFNDALARRAAKEGVPVIDFHSITADQDGRSNCRYHIDTHHLVPIALQAALNETVSHSVKCG